MRVMYATRALIIIILIYLTVLHLNFRLISMREELIAVQTKYRYIYVYCVIEENKFIINDIQINIVTDGNKLFMQERD